MAKKKPTSSDVAKLAGVSQSTVSMILNNYEHIRFAPDTVQRVMDACAKLNYRTPSARREGGSGEGNKCLMAMCPSFSNFYYINLLEAMQMQAYEKGYNMTVFLSRRNTVLEAQFVQMVRQQGAAGVFLMYKPINGAVLEQLASEVPVVLFCDKSGVSNVDIMEQDNEKMAVIVGEHLLSLGHRRIAFITTDLLDPNAVLRLQGLKEAFVKAKLSPYNIRACTIESEQMGYGPEVPLYDAGYRLGKLVVEKYKDITALVGLNDMVAIGIMDALIDEKYRIPYDYSVCGFDNTMISQYRRISLTSVENFDVNRGKEAVDVLIRKIEAGSSREEQESSSRFRVAFASKLIARGSTGPNRRKKQ